MLFNQKDIQEAHDEFVARKLDRLTKHKVNSILLVPIALIVMLTGFGIQHYVKAHKQVTRCSQFHYQDDAQSYYGAKLKGYYELYVNHDGKVCSTLPKK